MSIKDLFDALMGELEGLDTGGAREIVREIRKRVLTPEAVDGLDDGVCEAMVNGYTPPDKFRDAAIGRAMASAVAAHLCVVRTEEKAGEETPWYASLHGGQWRYINTHYRDAISDSILLGPLGSLEEAIAAAKKSDENRSSLRPEEIPVPDPRPINLDVAKLLRDMLFNENNKSANEARSADAVEARQRARYFGEAARMADSIIAEHESAKDTDPRPIVSDASQATDDQRRKAFRSFCPPVELDIPEDIDEADLGYSFIRAALSAVRLDASIGGCQACKATKDAICGVLEQVCFDDDQGAYPISEQALVSLRDAMTVRLDASTRPVLTWKEAMAFEGTFEKAGITLDAWRARGSDVEAYSAELRLCRTVVDRMKVGGGARRPAEASRPVLTEAETDLFSSLVESSYRCADELGDRDRAEQWKRDLATCRAAIARLKAGAAKLPHEMHPPFEGDPNQESFAKKPPLSSAEADKIVDDALSRVKAHGCHDPHTSGICETALRALRSRLVLPKPRRLSEKDAADLAYKCWAVIADYPTIADGHEIAAEVARLWGLPAPEHETPKVRRLSDEDADDLAGFAGDQLDSNKSLRADGHAIAAEVLRLLGLEYPK